MNYLNRTWAEIDINALIHNFKTIKSAADGRAVMAVVKANAYGHSVADVAPVLQNEGADFFAVSNLDEALQLRECGIVKPVLVLGYTPVDMAKTLIENDISQCVYSLEYAKKLSKRATETGNLKIHIKLDTGMSRLGFNCRTDELFGIEEALTAATLPSFMLEGIFTHFAVSDRTADTEDGFTDEQYMRYLKAVDIFEDNGLEADFCHCCNSGAILNDSDKLLSMCRPGIILYGLSPTGKDAEKHGLIPVMTLKSVVSMVKELPAGQTISYGRTHKTEGPLKIATIAAGYADGYPRALSDKAHVLIKGKKAKILGRVCMDQMVVDVSGIDDVKIGDEVLLFGKELPVDLLADICGTINYEIVCGISPRVPRVIVNK